MPSPILVAKGQGPPPPPSPILVAKGPSIFDSCPPLLSCRTAPPPPLLICRAPPPRPPQEMKGHNVSSNGGLLITFLLDEDPAPALAPQGHVLLSMLQQIDQPELYSGLPLPAALCDETCPREVFAFLEHDLLGSAGAAGAGAPQGAHVSTQASPTFQA